MNKFVSFGLAGLVLAGCANAPTTVSQASQDAQLLEAGVAGALAAAQAAIANPTPAQSAQFAQIQADLVVVQNATTAIANATATGTVAQQVEAAIKDLGPILVSVYPVSAPVVAAAEALVPVLVQEITGTTGEPLMAKPMDAGTARLVLAGQKSLAPSKSIFPLF